MSRLRVALVVPSASRRGGGDVWLAQLLRTLAPGQLDLLAVFETDGELAEVATAAGHRSAILGRGGEPTTADLTTLVAPLGRLLVEERPAVTVHWSPRAQVYGAEARRRAGVGGAIGWVQHVISTDFWLHRMANRAPADAVACVSSAVADANQALYPQRRTVVLHPGVDPVPAAVDRAAARSAFGVPADAFVVSVVGRVEPWKGQDLLVRALHLLHTGGIQAHALFVGETRSATWPQFAAQVSALVDQLGMSEHVTFTGHLDSPADALAAADVLVCSSREEGFSMAVAEAMAAGVPVVATRCGGPENFLTDGHNGLLVAAEDPAALAGALGRVAVDPPLAARLASAGRATWEDRFTARHTAGRFLAFVHELACGS